jgi:hypothetical protein
MRKVFIVAVVLLALATAMGAAAEAGPGTPAVYTGSMTAGTDGKNRSVLIVNAQTGDFEVFDIDNKGFDRKDNVEYYDCVSYNRETKTRIIYKYLIPGK